LPTDKNDIVQRTTSVEKELFELIAESDEAAFEKIFHTYNAKLLPFVTSITKNREAAEEIMQEVFLKLWLHRTSLTEIENPTAWLIRVSSNLALSYLQRLAIHTKVVKRISGQTSQTDTLVESEMDVKKIKEHVAVAVSQLPKNRRQIYNLSREDGLNRRQIAERMGIAESTVKNQLTAALKFIQEYIEKNYNIYLPLFLLLILKK